MPAEARIGVHNASERRSSVDQRRQLVAECNRIFLQKKRCKASLCRRRLAYNMRVTSRPQIIERHAATPPLGVRTSVERRRQRDAAGERGEEDARLKFGKRPVGAELRLRKAYKAERRPLEMVGRQHMQIEAKIVVANIDKQAVFNKIKIELIAGAENNLKMLKLEASIACLLPTSSTCSTIVRSANSTPVDVNERSAR